MPRPAPDDNLDTRVRQSSQLRREEGKVALRQRILREAAELLLEDGYEAFSLRKLAVRIGYSATTIYRHFRDKNDLISDVMDAGFEVFGERLAAATAAATDPVTRIGLLGRAYVMFGIDYPAYYRVMFIVRPDLVIEVPPERRQRWDATFGELVRAVEALIASGQSSVRDPLQLSRIFWAEVHGITSLTIILPVLESTEAALGLFDQMYDLLIRGLRPV